MAIEQGVCDQAPPEQPAPLLARAIIRQAFPTEDEHDDAGGDNQQDATHHTVLRTLHEGERNEQGEHRKQRCRMALEPKGQHRRHGRTEEDGVGDAAVQFVGPQGIEERTSEHIEVGDGACDGAPEDGLVAHLPTEDHLAHRCTQNDLRQ